MPISNAKYAYTDFTFQKRVEYTLLKEKNKLWMLPFECCQVAIECSTVFRINEPKYDHFLRTFFRSLCYIISYVSAVTLSSVVYFKINCVLSWFHSHVLILFKKWNMWSFSRKLPFRFCCKRVLGTMIWLN